MLEVASAAGHAEPISPELVLVCPELRAGALAALHLPEGESLELAPTRPVESIVAAVDGHAQRRRRSLLTHLLAYVAWQTLVGVLLGVAVVATVAAVVAVVAFLGR